jgi:hypothetical protein
MNEETWPDRDGRNEAVQIMLTCFTAGITFEEFKALPYKKRMSLPRMGLLDDDRLRAGLVYFNEERLADKFDAQREAYRYAYDQALSIARAPVSE